MADKPLTHVLLGIVLLACVVLAGVLALSDKGIPSLIELVGGGALGGLAGVAKPTGN